MFGGDTVYYIETEEEPELCFKVNKYKIKYSGRFLSDESLHSFSTKEKAEEYILYNKPILSLKDVASIYPGINKNHPDKPSSQSERLKNLVKSKIQQSV